ncbi:unnamed protein product [Amoebophrya sp. A25]|nr:unnamed protein product [Amoebophrya sp. A25]|eukprot:GSA25T00007961001.1
MAAVLPSDLQLSVATGTEMTGAGTSQGSNPIPSGVAELLGNPATCFVDGAEVGSLDIALGDARYVALCFSASYCKYCKEFVPLLETALPLLKKEKACRVVLIGGDKTEEAFDQYREQHKDFVSMTFSATEPVKLRLREQWDIKTIPHVVLWIACRVSL